MVNSTIIERDAKRLMLDSAYTPNDIMQYADSIEDDLRQIIDAYGASSAEAAIASQALAEALVNIPYRTFSQAIANKDPLKQIAKEAYLALLSLSYVSRLPLAASFYTPDIKTKIAEIQGMGAIYKSMMRTPFAAFCPMMTEDAFWKECEECGCFDAYLSKFPNGKYSDIAKQRVLDQPTIEEMEETEEPQSNSSTSSKKGVIWLIALAIVICIGSFLMYIICRNRLSENDIKALEICERVASRDDIYEICSLTDDKKIIKQATDNFWFMVKASTDTMPLPCINIYIDKKCINNPLQILADSVPYSCLYSERSNRYATQCWLDNYNDYLHTLMDRANSEGTYTAWARLRNAIPNISEEEFDISPITGKIDEITYKITKYCSESPKAAYRLVKKEQSYEACEFYIENFFNTHTRANTRLMQVKDMMTERIRDELHRVSQGDCEFPTSTSIIIPNFTRHYATVALTYNLSYGEDQSLKIFPIKHHERRNNRPYIFLVPKGLDCKIIYHGGKDMLGRPEYVYQKINPSKDIETPYFYAPF